METNIATPNERMMKNSLTAKEKIELFYFLFKECGLFNCSRLYNAVIAAVEDNKELPEFYEKE